MPWPLALARLTTWSALAKANLPLLASVEVHFIEFSAVIMPNSFLLSAMAMYLASGKLLTSMAVPKYSLPALTMSECRPSAVALAVVVVVVLSAGAAVTEPAVARAMRRARVSLAIVSFLILSLPGWVLGASEVALEGS